VEREKINKIKFDGRKSIFLGCELNMRTYQSSNITSVNELISATVVELYAKIQRQYDIISEAMYETYFPEKYEIIISNAIYELDDEQIKKFVHEYGFYRAIQAVHSNDNIRILADMDEDEFYSTALFAIIFEAPSAESCLSYQDFLIWDNDYPYQQGENQRAEGQTE
jgi:hypothetical protein